MKRRSEKVTLLGTLLEKYMRKTGMSTIDVAKRIGISSERVRQLMTRSHPPRFELAAKFAQLLGLSSDDMMRIATDKNMYLLPHGSEIATVCDAERVDDKTSEKYAAVLQSISAMHGVLTDMGRQLDELKKNVIDYSSIYATDGRTRQGRRRKRTID